MKFHAFHFGWLGIVNHEAMILFGFAAGRVDYEPEARWLYSVRLFLGVCKIEVLFTAGEKEMQDLEELARQRYEEMRANDPEGERYPWVPGGNSDKQEEARHWARDKTIPESAGLGYAMGPNPEYAKAEEIPMVFHPGAIKQSIPPQFIQVATAKGIEVVPNPEYHKAVKAGKIIHPDPFEMNPAAKLCMHGRRMDEFCAECREIMTGANTVRHNPRRG